MININSNLNYLIPEIKLICNLFAKQNNSDISITHTCDYFQQSNNNFLISNKVLLNINNTVFSLENENCATLENDEKITKYLRRFAKISVYKLFQKAYKYNVPWGSLTGIRPVKLYSELKNSFGKEFAIKEFKNSYDVQDKRIQICDDIFELQRKINICSNDIHLYINIPFCTSKCYYCSFISLPISKCENIIQPYINTLLYELSKTLEYLKNNGKVIKTIYIGGGTPTSITTAQLESILKLLPKVTELTVEAGRPDTITEEKLDLLKKYNVTRISINPQTFNDTTLINIGRKHSSKDVVNVFNLAKKYNFIINMDLIAGLDNEKLDDFKNTLTKTISLNPHNITIHTLCIKNSSNLKTIGGAVSEDIEAEKMVEYSINELYSHNYLPYYLYKQKYALSNLENIGYCKDFTSCEFNVISMEENASVIAVGANAISKRLFENNRIERFANPKNITDYISKIEMLISKKFELFKFD